MPMRCLNSQRSSWRLTAVLTLGFLASAFGVDIQTNTEAVSEAQTLGVTDYNGNHPRHWLSLPVEDPSQFSQGDYVNRYPAKNTNRDYNGGEHTYGPPDMALPHYGIDYTLAYKSNKAVKWGKEYATANSGWIVAAADGKVVHAINDVTDKTCFGEDKPFSRVCGYNDLIGGGRLGNSVWIEHPQAKGYVTGYGHMLPGSVQVKKGDTVTCGQRLGRCGVSGFSFGPHLHFMVKKANNADAPVVDPNDKDPSKSMWIKQGDYKKLPGNACDTVPANNNPQQNMNDVSLECEANKFCKKNGYGYLHRGEGDCTADTPGYKMNGCSCRCKHMECKVNAMCKDGWGFLMLGQEDCTMQSAGFKTAGCSCKCSRKPASTPPPSPPPTADDPPTEDKQDATDAASSSSADDAAATDADGDKPITAIVMIFGSSPSIRCPSGFDKMDGDLNEGNGGKYVFLCLKRADNRVPVTELSVVAGDKASSTCPPGTQTVRFPDETMGDTNKGAGGDFVRICYKVTRTGKAIVNIRRVKSTTAADGFTVIDTNLNAGGKGKSLYLAYKQRA